MRLKRQQASEAKEKLHLLQIFLHSVSEQACVKRRVFACGSCLETVVRLFLRSGVPFSARIFPIGAIFGEASRDDTCFKRPALLKGLSDRLLFPV